MIYYRHEHYIVTFSSSMYAFVLILCMFTTILCILLNEICVFKLN